MRKYYAKKGEIPEQGEIWLPVGDKGHLMMLHLVDIDQVRPFVPAELDIAPIGFGKTLGLVFMTSMGPESTLPYHELIIAPALIRAQCRYGFFVSHIYVDNEKSRIGGIRNFGLAKQPAEFSWDWRASEPGCVIVRQENRNLITINYGKAMGAVPFTLGGNAASMLENKLMLCRNSFKARYGLAKVTYSVPAGSPLHDDLGRMGLGDPLCSVLGRNMRGVMGADTQAVAFFPRKEAIL